MTYVHRLLTLAHHLSRAFSAALAVQPRPVQFNLCIWGAANVWEWGSRVVRSVRLLIPRVFAEW